MSKKSFIGGFDSLLGEHQIKNMSAKKNKEEEVRATFQFTTHQLKDIKAIAYWERKKLKEIMNEALSSYIDKYVKEKGNIKPITE